MAIWQFGLIVAPRASVIARYGVVPSTLPEAEAECGEWWTSSPPPPELEQWLREILPEFASWSENVRMWGENSGHKIDAVYDERTRSLTELVLYVDARDLREDLLESYAVLGRRLDALFLARPQFVIEPTPEALRGALLRSRARAFVDDPIGTLQKLPKVDVEPN